MNVYFVRHGESEGNKNNRHQTAEEPLTPYGKAQARKVAKRLTKLDIDLIYASPMRRAQQTAKIIQKKIGKPIETWDSLHELMRPSKIQGLTADNPKSIRVTRLIAKNFYKKSWKYDDEENFKELNIRARDVLNHLVKYHKSQDVLCVSHGTFTKTIACKAIFGKKLTPEIFAEFRYSSFIANTGITHLEFTDKYGWTLMSWNDTTHL